MNFAAFQRVYAASDVRTVIVFEGPYMECFPHLAVQSTVMDVLVEVFANDENDVCPVIASPVAAQTAALDTVADRSFGASSMSLHSNASTSASVVIEHKSAFIKKFERCFDKGQWLLVANMESVPYTEWRTVSQRLVSTLPDSRFRERASFRLFTFLPPGTAVQRLAPPLLCQFCINVTSTGEISSRSEVSPIFKGGGSVDITDTKKAEAEIEATTISQTLSNGRLDPYASAYLVRQKSLGIIDRKVGAYEPEYVDEVLCSLREAMLEEQAELREQAIEKSRELVIAITGMPGEVSAQELGQGDQDKEWIYHKLLAWVVELCPDADISALPEIAPASIETAAIAWQNSKEVCEGGVWCGADVLVKHLQQSLVQKYNEQSTKGFGAEAARHFQLRHPNILQLYGMSNGRMVMEAGRGTLEQALIRSRYDGQRWTIRRFLKLAQCVLRGLCYLETLVIHRDIACRSVIEVSDHGFKIGQFALALSLGHSRMEAIRGSIPIRWCAPEALGCEFSTASDVWSFGVMMWEAVHYATRVPYDEAAEFAAPLIMGGTVLARPKECPEILYETVILPCFVTDPSERPTAAHVLLGVEKALGLWDAKLQDQFIPFPTDGESFETANQKRR